MSFDRQGAHSICEFISDLINKRRKAQEGIYADKQRPLHHFVIFFGSKDMIEHEDTLQLILDMGYSVGITSVFIFDDIYLLPHQCKYIINLDSNACAYDSTQANNKFFFTPDTPVSDKTLDIFARRMSAIELDGFFRRAGLPDGITFLQGYGVERVEELNVIKRWNEAQPYSSLAAPIGMMAGEKTFSLDIHEKAFGPHGLVAGTTGSEKSELLQTWILFMALTFHPHDVTFVLIDYKGGGMASMLEPLPHVVGKITNIGNKINRSLISLQSEIKRRQKNLMKSALIILISIKDYTKAV